MIGNGVVVDPVLLVEELRSLELEGIGPVRLVISDRFTSVCPIIACWISSRKNSEQGRYYRLSTLGA